VVECDVVNHLQALGPKKGVFHDSLPTRSRGSLGGHPDADGNLCERRTHSRHIAAAVADGSRPEADKIRDVNRKPAETLAFTGVKPGMQIAELFAGRRLFHAHIQQGRGRLGTCVCAGAGALGRCAGGRAGFCCAREGDRRRPELLQCECGGGALQSARPCLRPSIWSGPLRNYMTCTISPVWMWGYSIKWCSTT